MLRRARTWWHFRRAVIRARRMERSPRAGEKDVLVLPCWQRPEFLWHCLDNLTRAEAICSVHVLFRPDTGFLPENLDIIHSFADRLPSFEIELPQPCPFRRTKPSANLLLGCLHAAAITRRYVFLVEEDIMVARDFLTWHRAVQAAENPLFCSIAVRNPNRLLTLPEEPGGYYLSSGDYCSNGVCFDKYVLRCAIAPHVNMAYLRRPKKYLRRHFPASAVSLGFVEQDGLARRIQEQSRSPIAWPCMPRAFHSGFFGARGGWQNFVRPNGIGESVQDRVRTLAGAIYSHDAMRNAVDIPEFIDSCRPCNLELPAWKFLNRIEVPPATAVRVS